MPFPFKVDMSMFATSRRRLVESLAVSIKEKADEDDSNANALIPPHDDGCCFLLFRGGEQVLKDETDSELPFRQNSWFNYLFGVKETNVYAVIAILGSHHLPAFKTTLFVPRLPPEYEIWCGRIISAEEFREMYEVDEVKYTDELDAFFTASSSSSGAGEVNGATQYPIYTLTGRNSDSGNDIPPIKLPFEHSSFEAMITPSSLLFDTLSNQRVIKSAAEISLMRYCAYIASNAHVRVMRQARAGMQEYELEAWFLFDIYKEGGARFTPYTCICACGPNAATLHYGHAGKYLSSASHIHSISCIE